MKTKTLKQFYRRLGTSVVSLFSLSREMILSKIYVTKFQWTVRALNWQLFSSAFNLISIIKVPSLSTRQCQTARTVVRVGQVFTEVLEALQKSCRRLLYLVPPPSTPSLACSQQGMAPSNRNPFKSRKRTSFLRAIDKTGERGDASPLWMVCILARPR